MATFSILGYDPETGEIGGAVQSRVFSVGNGVLWAEWITEQFPDGANILYLSGPAGNSQGTEQLDARLAGDVAVSGEHHGHVGGLVDLVDRADVGVAQRRGGLRLPAEALPRERPQKNRKARTRRAFQWYINAITCG